MIFGDISLQRLIAAVVALLVGLTFHEFSHAFVADELGDRQPRAMGRLTLNPIAHIDPIGALMLVVAGFGWAKPVMVNTAALRGGRRSMAVVAFAGPLANVAVAIVFAVVFRVLALGGQPSGFVPELIALIVQLNILAGDLQSPADPAVGRLQRGARVPPASAGHAHRALRTLRSAGAAAPDLPARVVRCVRCSSLSAPVTRALIGA